MSSRRQEVWGSPIHHSLSPLLHRAAYRALGLDCEYRAVEVTTESLGDSFTTLDPVVEGVSLTMPLKEAILELVSDHRGPVDLLRAANTLVRRGEAWWIDNTDWWGAQQTIDKFGGVAGCTVWLLGAGATARAMLYALSQSGPAEVVSVVRSAERALVNSVLAQTLGLPHRVVLFDDLLSEHTPHWVVSTLPAGEFAALDLVVAGARDARLFDVAYRPWPSSLASRWASSSEQENLGLWMLSFQALAQVRAFVHGDSMKALEREEYVFAQMCDAVGLSAGVGE